MNSIENKLDTLEHFASVLLTQIKLVKKELSRENELSDVASGSSPKGLKKEIQKKLKSRTLRRVK